MYQRRPVRKTIFSYMMPLIVIVAMFLVVILSWRLLNQFFSGDEGGTETERVFLNIEQGSAKAMTTELGEWQNAPDKIYLYQGELVRTGGDSEATLTYFDQSILRLGGGAEVRFDALKKENKQTIIKTTLNEGEAWAKIGPMPNPDDSFALETQWLTVDSQDGIFTVMAPGTVRVVKGAARVGVKKEGEVVKAFNLGVGQQIIVDQPTLDALMNGETNELISAWNNDFTQSEWYLWNRQKDGAITAYEETENETAETSSEAPAIASVTAEKTATETPPAAKTDVIAKVVYVTSPSVQAATSQETIELKGRYDPKGVAAVFVNSQKAALDSETGTWGATGIKLPQEGVNRLKITATDMDGKSIALDDFVVTYDKTPPPAPLFTEPGLNGATVKIESTEQIIKGVVSADTQTVIVNDYALGKYVPESKEFVYYAKVAYGNLAAGDNLYQAYAEDKAGNRSEVATLTLTLDQKTIDSTESLPPKTPAAPSAETSAASASDASGSVIITSPNNGNDVKGSETFYELQGAVPKETASVRVNDYTLGAYQPGSSEWKYRASVQLGNLKTDEKNVFTVTAFDAEGKSLGSDSITITVQVDKLTTPVITFPTDKGEYSTSLNVVTIGGTVSKGTEYVYVNGEKITYEEGSGQWRKSVTLSPGDNTFRIYATQGESKSGTIMITIKYY